MWKENRAGLFKEHQIPHILSSQHAAEPIMSYKVNIARNKVRIVIYKHAILIFFSLILLRIRDVMINCNPVENVFKYVMNKSWFN